MLNTNLLPPDVRGTITKCEIVGTKFNVLYTKAGALRSGDFHDSTQFDLVLSGEWEITTFENGKDVVRKYSSNNLIQIPPNTPHLFRALIDNVTIEWWDKEFQAQYYGPYREQVDKQLVK